MQIAFRLMQRDRTIGQPLAHVRAGIESGIRTVVGEIADVQRRMDVVLNLDQRSLFDFEPGMLRAQSEYLVEQ
jgi:hypothetical protein